jgi:uncharacterized protein involved in exopolysaccharide biosynthesis
VTNKIATHEINFLELWIIVTKQKLLILLIIFFATLTGVIIAWTAPTLYTGNALIEIGEVINSNYNVDKLPQSTLIINLDDVNNLKEITIQGTGVNATIPTGTNKILNLTIENENPSIIKLKLEDAVHFILSRHHYGNTDSKVHMTQMIGKIHISPDPIKPNKKLIVLVSFFCGVIIAFLLAFFINFFSIKKNQTI